MEPGALLSKLAERKKWSFSDVVGISPERDGIPSICFSGKGTLEFMVKNGNLLRMGVYGGLGKDMDLSVMYERAVPDEK